MSSDTVSALPAGPGDVKGNDFYRRRKARAIASVLAEIPVPVDTVDRWGAAVFHPRHVADTGYRADADEKWLAAIKLACQQSWYATPDAQRPVTQWRGCSRLTWEMVAQIMRRREAAKTRSAARRQRDTAVAADPFHGLVPAS